MEAIKHLCIQADVMFKLKKFKSAAGDLWVLNFDDCVVSLQYRWTSRTVYFGDSGVIVLTAVRLSTAPPGAT